MEHNFEIIVQKYGGSSVAQPQKITEVAGFIKNKLKNNQRICVVVSAMGDTTNELLGLAKQVNPLPPKRELDMLLSCGERSSMALLAMALCHQGVKALSLTGSQSGIITDECHSGAELLAIRPYRVLEAFKSYEVVIIAGFQGVSRAHEITTLRRGGSDTTAVAMAAALKARICEIYSDVPGFMSIDPRIKAHAELISELDYDQACSFSLYGAKILAHDAARLAQNLGVELLLAQSTKSDTGTRIGEIPMKNPKNQLVRCITHLRGVIRLELLQHDLENLGDGFFLCGSWKNNNLIGYASNDIAQELPPLLNAQVRAGLALITIHVAHQQAILIVIKKLIDICKKNNFEMLDLITGSSQIFVIMSDEILNHAMSIVHDGLIKDR
jgi:aspartokinase